MGNSNLYTNKFKSIVVDQVMRGEMTIESARKKYRLKDSSTILQWMEESTKGKSSGKRSTKKSEPEEMSKAEVLAKIKALEAALHQAELKVAGYNLMIDIAEKELKVPIRKKSDTK